MEFERGILPTDPISEALRIIKKNVKNTVKSPAKNRFHEQIKKAL